MKNLFGIQIQLIFMAFILLLFESVEEDLVQPPPPIN